MGSASGLGPRTQGQSNQVSLWQTQGLLKAPMLLSLLRRT